MASLNVSMFKEAQNFQIYGGFFTNVAGDQRVHYHAPYVAHYTHNCYHYHLCDNTEIHFCHDQGGASTSSEQVELDLKLNSNEGRMDVDMMERDPFDGPRDSPQDRTIQLDMDLDMDVKEEAAPLIDNDIVMEDAQDAACTLPV